MNHLTTLTPEQARQNFLTYLDYANVSDELYADIAQAAIDWISTVRIEARQNVLTAYRTNSFPHDKTYGA